MPNAGDVGPPSEKSTEAYSTQDVLRIAEAQRHLLVFFLVGCVVYFLASTLSSAVADISVAVAKALFIFFVVGLLLANAYFIRKLTNALRLPRTWAATIILSPIAIWLVWTICNLTEVLEVGDWSSLPAGTLILMLNSKAMKVLRATGLRVGFLGVSSADLEKLKPKQRDPATNLSRTVAKPATTATPQRSVRPPLTVPVLNPLESDGPTATQPVTNQSSTVQCPSCGNENWGSATVCFTCGSRLDAEPQMKATHRSAAIRPDPSPANSETRNVSIPCQHCGTTLWASSTQAGKILRCPTCRKGTRVPQPAEVWTRLLTCVVIALAVGLAAYRILSSPKLSRTSDCPVKISYVRFVENQGVMFDCSNSSDKPVSFTVHVDFIDASGNVVKETRDLSLRIGGRQKEEFAAEHRGWDVKGARCEISYCSPD